MQAFGFLVILALAGTEIWAGANPDARIDHRIRTLRDLNPAYWDSLGLNVLQGAEGLDTELEISSTSDNIREIITQICNANRVSAPPGINNSPKSAPGSQVRPIANDKPPPAVSEAIRESESSVDGEIRLARAAQAVPVPLFIQTYLPRVSDTLVNIHQRLQLFYLQQHHHFQQLRLCFNRLSQRCERAINKYCPGLLYNPLSLVRINPAIDPAKMPVRWLQYPSIVQHLACWRVRTHNSFFMRRLRNFNAMILPVNSQWYRAVLSGLSFRDSTLAHQNFYECQLSDSDLRGSQLYRCTFAHCTVANIQSDEGTQIHTSTVEFCVDQPTMDVLTKITFDLDDPVDGAAAIARDTVQHMLTLWFTEQIKQAAVVNALVDAVTSDQVNTFIDEYPSLTEQYPDLITIVLQTLYAVACSSATSLPTEGLQGLMQAYASRSLTAMTHVQPVGGLLQLELLLGQVRWPQAGLTQAQIAYQQNVHALLHSHQMSAISIPMDNDCFYHVLSHQITHQQSTYDESSAGNQSMAMEVREKIIAFLNAYLAYRDGTLPEGALSTPATTSQFNCMDVLLHSSTIDISMVNGLLEDAQTPNSWPDVSALPVIAIIFDQPVFFIEPHLEEAATGFIHNNGTVQSDWHTQFSWEEIQGYSPIFIIHDSNNHWFTAVSLTLQALLLLQPLQSGDCPVIQ